MIIHHHVASFQLFCYIASHVKARTNVCVCFRCCETGRDERDSKLRDVGISVPVSEKSNAVCLRHFSYIQILLGYCLSYLAEILGFSC